MCVVGAGSYFQSSGEILRFTFQFLGLFVATRREHTCQGGGTQDQRGREGNLSQTRGHALGLWQYERTKN